MIGRLKGIVDEINHDHILLDVGGVGYVVYITKNNIQNLNEGQKAVFYTEQQIAENSVKLYGLSSREEQKILRILIKVKGISYKGALNLIDAVGPQGIVSSVQQKNELGLKVKGIGDKLIKRIITETREDFLKLKVGAHNNTDYNQSNYAQAVSALLNLGFEKSACQAVLDDILAKEPDLSVDKIVILALKKL